jgi:hypothetical protein
MAERPDLRSDRRGLTPVVLLAATMALVLVACGSDADSSGTAGTAAVTTDVGSGTVPTERELAGIVREPAPVVDATTLPSLTDPGTEVAFRADPGGFQAVYFRLHELSRRVPDHHVRLDRHAASSATGSRGPGQHGDGHRRP